MSRRREEFCFEDGFRRLSKKISKFVVCFFLIVITPSRLSPPHHSRIPPPLSLLTPTSHNREQLELLEEKLRELAALPRGDSRSDDDRAVALSQVDALRKELALVCRAGLPSVVFGKVRRSLAQSGGIERERTEGQGRESRSAKSELR